MLRRVTLGLGIVFLAAALALFLRGDFCGGGFTLGFYGLMIVGGIIFERWRYRPIIDRTHGPWQPTDEIFTDPTSHQKMQVYFNPVTGERDYRPIP